MTLLIKNLCDHHQQIAHKMKVPPQETVEIRENLLLSHEWKGLIDALVDNKIHITVCDEDNVPVSTLNAARPDSLFSTETLEQLLAQKSRYAECLRNDYYKLIDDGLAALDGLGFPGNMDLIQQTKGLRELYDGQRTSILESLEFLAEFHLRDPFYVGLREDSLSPSRHLMVKAFSDREADIKRVAALLGGEVHRNSDGFSTCVMRGKARTAMRALRHIVDEETKGRINELLSFASENGVQMVTFDVGASLNDVCSGEGFKGGEMMMAAGATGARGKSTLATYSKAGKEEADRVFSIASASCECGAAATGSLANGPGHSHWCPVYGGSDG
jgi:hypothetical protein